MPDVTAAPPLTAAEAREGLSAPAYTLGPITRTDIVRYAGAGGDFNPIHHDEPFARSLGLPSVFSMGLFQGGLVSRLAADWLGLANLRRFGTRFRAQVWPGEVLILSGRLVSVRPTEDGVAVEAEFTAANEVGEVKIASWAAAVIPAAPPARASSSAATA
jgi:acyl dehydratase